MSAILQNRAGRFVSAAVGSIQRTASSAVSALKASPTASLVLLPAGDAYPIVCLSFAVLPLRPPAEATPHERLLTEFIASLVRYDRLDPSRPVMVPLPPDLRDLSLSILQHSGAGRAATKPSPSRGGTAPVVTGTGRLP